MTLLRSTPHALLYGARKSNCFTAHRSTAVSSSLPAGTLLVVMIIEPIFSSSESSGSGGLPVAWRTAMSTACTDDHADGLPTMTVVAPALRACAAAPVNVTPYCLTFGLAERWMACWIGAAARSPG